MRIVHVSDCFAPRVGGIENQVHDLGVQQAKAGHAVHVLTATATERGSEGPGGSRYRASKTESEGLRVHRLASPLTFGVPVHPRGRAMIHRGLRLLEPDVVHVHAGVVSPFAWDGVRAARALELPTVITWHCVLEGVQRLFRMGTKVTRWKDDNFALSAVSDVVARQLHDIFGREDIAVVPNGLDLGPWRGAAAKRESSDHGVLRVVASQRLAHRKRPMALVRILQRVHQRLGPGPGGEARIQLTIAGDGTSAGAVRTAIADAGLEHVVTMLGQVPRELLPTLYRDHDVFLSPVHLEAFGIAALEARASGLAVVGMADSGIAEFVAHGSEGLLNADDQGIEDSLVRLAQNPAWLQEIVQHNVGNPPPFGWEDVLDRVDDVYARALSLQAVGN